MHALSAIAVVMLLPFSLNSLKHRFYAVAIPVEAQDRAVSPIFEVVRVCLLRPFYPRRETPARFSRKDCQLVERVIFKVLNLCDGG